MTICCSRRWNVKYARKLPASVFYPQPKVLSGVVTFQRKPVEQVPMCDDAVFESLVRTGYSERRKQLRNLLSQHKERWPEICAHLGVAETVRAEELRLPQWEKLARLVNPVEAQRASEIFDVVNERDEVIDAQPRESVHVNNLRHRAVHMVVFNSLGELFLQKRSIWKDKNPGVWDSSAAGHVDSGETYETAAQREIGEELGIQCELQRIGKLSCTEQTGWEFIEVYRGVHEGPFTLAPLEVETGAFFPLEQIREWIRRSPGDFSPVFLKCLELLETAPKGAGE